jgi:peptidoglycan-associated lipoprotein
MVALGARRRFEEPIHRGKLEREFYNVREECQMSRGVRVCATLALAAVVGVSACGKKKPAPPPPAPPPAAEAPRTTPTPPPPPPPPAPRETPTRPPTEDEVFARKSLSDLNAEKPLGDPYFDLDSSQIRSDAQPVLQRDADWLKRWASTKVSVEGHCDSRGTAEYNLALGERRATAIRDYLVSLGIGSDRIQVVSKGKEQPVCSEENEACWQQNRRGHFLITAK